MFSTKLDGTITISETSILSLIKSFTFTDNAVTDFEFYDSYSIADAVSNAPLNFGRITTVKYIYIESDKNITIKLDSTGNTAIKVYNLLLIATSTTAIYISNNSGSTANLKIILAGTV